MYTIQYLRTLVVFAIGGAICVACGNSPGVPAASPDITSADSAIGGAQDSAVTADSSTIVDMIGDSDVGDVSDVGTDAGSANDTADVLVCSDMPKEGCPCNASIAHRIWNQQHPEYSQVAAPPPPATRQVCPP